MANNYFVDALRELSRVLNTEENRQRREQMFDAIGSSVQKQTQSPLSQWLADVDEPAAYTRKEFEPLVTGAILASQLLLAETQNSAHKPGKINLQTTQNGTYTGRPYVFDIFRGGEAQPSATATIATTMMRSISAITIDNDRDGVPDMLVTARRNSFGNAESLELDQNNDAVPDVYLVPVRESARYGYVRGLGIRNEPNGDNVAFISFLRDDTTYITEIGLDTNGDGSVEQYYKVKRNGERSLTRITPE